MNAQALPTPNGAVTDTAGMLKPETKEVLAKTLNDYYSNTGNSVVVVTVSSLEGDTIENVAAALFSKWGIGQKKKDNGVLLLISKGDQELRIEVGYGLEPVLTDAKSSRIIREIIIPYFKADDFSGGVTAGVEAIIGVIGGDTSALPESKPKEDVSGLVFPLLWALFIALSWLASILARSKSWWAGGVVGAVLGAVVTFFGGFFYWGLLAFAVMVPIGLLFDFIISREFEKNAILGKKNPWWGGGGFGPGGGFGGGGGGFGGFGGGMSGGGGASGKW
jgi:uncharacterized protein